MGCVCSTKSDTLLPRLVKDQQDLKYAEFATLTNILFYKQRIKQERDLLSSRIDMKDDTETTILAHHIIILQGELDDCNTQLTYIQSLLDKQTELIQLLQHR